MRILQVTSTFYPALTFGGAVRVILNVSRELVKRGHEVTVYSTNAFDQKRNFQLPKKECMIEGIKVRYFKNLLHPDNLFISPSMILALRKGLQKFDVVHVHFGRQIHDAVTWHYAKNQKIPYVLQAHGSLPRIRAIQRLKWIYDVFFGYRLLKDASKVIAITQMEAEQYRSMSVFEGKIEIIPHGIDRSEFDDLPRRGVFRKKHGISNGEKLILYIGRIHKIKGIDILIKAYASLLKELRDTKLVIVGPDDGYLPACKELATQFGVDRKILFSGPLYGKDKLEVYVDADVCVLPSRYEIFGMTILEACACARPVVATNVCGAALDVITNRRTGFLVQPENVLELTEALRHLLTNEAESKKMGMQARERVMSMFSIQNVVAKIENLYKEILL